LIHLDLKTPSIQALTGSRYPILRTVIYTGSKADLALTPEQMLEDSVGIGEIRRLFKIKKGVS
jgi:hypothetical protein